MIYFDNAATGGTKPDGVLTAVTSAIKICANPGRSGHKLSLSCAETVYECREELSAYFGGYGYERVIFTKNCTEALNIAIFGILKKGDHVIVSAMEHNSVLRPIYYLSEIGFITYDICPLKDGNIDLSALRSLVKNNTRMAFITTASNVTGTMPNINKIRDILPENVILACDGAQGGGHVEIDMKKQGIDVLTLAGHKGLMSIQGSGALLFSNRVTPSPVIFGGTGSESFSLSMPEFYPDRLEAGTLCFPAVSGLLQGIRYLSERKERISKKLCFFTSKLISALKNTKNYKVYSTPNPCGIVAFSHNTIQSETLSYILSEKYGFATRGGLHCAPLMHKALNTEENGLLRVSFSHFNYEDELNEFISALQNITENDVIL